jgi:hypothetical protein
MEYGKVMNCDLCDVNGLRAEIEKLRAQLAEERLKRLHAETVAAHWRENAFTVAETTQRPRRPRYPVARVDE